MKFFVNTHTTIISSYFITIIFLILHTIIYLIPLKEVFKEVFKEYTTRARDLLFILEEIKKEVFFTYILLFCDPFQIFLLLKFHHGYLRIIYNHQHDISIYLLISLLTVFHGFLDHHNQLNFLLPSFFMILDVCLSSFLIALLPILKTLLYTFQIPNIFQTSV